MPKPNVREKLIETALERFQDQGFNGCGVQDITDGAGVPKGSFYNHFKSKEALALEVLDRYCCGNKLEILSDVTQPPIARLKAHFTFLARRFEDWHFTRGCLLSNFATETSDTNPIIREAMVAAFERWSAAVADVLRQAQTEKAIDAKFDPEALARYLISAWTGAVTCAKVKKSRRSLEDFFSVTFQILLMPPAN